MRGSAASGDHASSIRSVARPQQDLPGGARERGLNSPDGLARARHVAIEAEGATRHRLGQLARRLSGEGDVDDEAGGEKDEV